jgi:hypothetical protein
MEVIIEEVDVDQRIFELIIIPYLIEFLLQDEVDVVLEEELLDNQVQALVKIEKEREVIKYQEEPSIMIMEQQMETYLKEEMDAKVLIVMVEEVEEEDIMEEQEVQQQLIMVLVGQQVEVEEVVSFIIQFQKNIQ